MTGVQTCALPILPDASDGSKFDDQDWDRSVTCNMRVESVRVDHGQIGRASCRERV